MDPWEEFRRQMEEMMRPYRELTRHASEIAHPLLAFEKHLRQQTQSVTRLAAPMAEYSKDLQETVRALTRPLAEVHEQLNAVRNLLRESVLETSLAGEQFRALAGKYALAGQYADLLKDPGIPRCCAATRRIAGVDREPTYSDC